jgi:hypothetical protein
MTIAQAQISNVSSTAVLTSSGNNAITSMVFCNTTAGSVTLTVYLVPSGGSAGDSTTIVKSLTIVANDTYVFDTSKFILSNGDALRAISDTNNAVTATVSYVSI